MLEIQQCLEPTNINYYTYVFSKYVVFTTHFYNTHDHTYSA